MKCKLRIFLELAFLERVENAGQLKWGRSVQIVEWLLAKFRSCRAPVLAVRVRF